MRPFTKRRSASVAALGEERLIAAIRRWLGTASPSPPGGIGDDCAVIAGVRGPLLLTVDPIIYGRHFDDAVPVRAAGAKLLKRNLSDIAAMGGRPVAAVVALTLDPRVSRAWLEAFHRGLAACARRHRVSVVGGDIAQGGRGVLAASLTLLGAAAGPRVLTRRGARIGDWIYVTGRLGGSLRSGHHHSFRPRLEEGVWFAKRPAVRSMMDVSDGLAKDLWSLTPRNAAPALDAEAIPRRRGASLRAALSDGEDYELAVAVGKGAALPAFERAWRRAFPRTPLTRIGHFAPADKIPPNALRLGDYRGFAHLQTGLTQRRQAAEHRQQTFPTKSENIERSDF